MIKGLSDFEKFVVVRPIIGSCEYDIFDMPIIRKESAADLDWENISAIGIQNASTKTASKQKIVLMFVYDKRLIPLWNNPLKKVGLFHSFAAIATPDFSIYPAMNVNEIQHNVYMSRWLGVTWQNYGCTVFPTVGWALPNTYDICFSGIEKGSIVVISTIGCQSHKKEFLDGFKAMKTRINPPLIVVYGDMIEGMTGTFIHFRYKDTHCVNKDYEQIKIDGISNLFTIEEVA